MYDVHHRLGVSLENNENADATVILNHEQRERGRLLLTSTQGTEIRLFLKRGQPLMVGELLKSDCGKLIKIEGAEEAVAVAHCEDWHTFALACYHLGNRHVKVQVKALTLMIKPDHVLEEMLQLLELTISHKQAIFVPESGAYKQSAHAH